MRAEGRYSQGVFLFATSGLTLQYPLLSVHKINSGVGGWVGDGGGARVVGHPGTRMGAIRAKGSSPVTWPCLRNENVSCLADPTYG